MKYRIANNKDVKELAALRWIFRMESGEEKAVVGRAEFEVKCTRFFQKALESGYHTFWIAEDAGAIVGQLFVHKIDLIPRPCKIEDSFGYITNNYVLPDYRGKGVGSGLLKRVIDWAKAEDMELLIVYPSDRARTLYEKAGFDSDNDVMELKLREYYSEEWIK